MNEMNDFNDIGIARQLDLPRVIKLLAQEFSMKKRQWNTSFCRRSAYWVLSNSISKHKENTPISAGVKEEI